jgi:hypothetical protein
MKHSTNQGLVLIVISVAGVFGQPATVHATPILQVRCSNDSLDPATAKKRLEWARACGTRINLVSPTTPTYPAWAELTGTYDSKSVALWEYYETNDFWGKNSYSGDSAAVNQTFTTMQWKIGPITAVTAAGGFQKWTETSDKELLRPNYPTFGNNVDINLATPLFPHPSYDPSNCGLYLDQAGTQPANTSVSGFYVNGFCTSSCYTPEQEIRFATGDEQILSAMTELRTGVTTLTPESTLQNIQLQTDDVFSYTRELRDGTHVILEIRTASGGKLRVTDKHPVIEGNGRVVEAQALRVGNRLIKPDGTLDPIVSITTATYFGKVYNLKPRSTGRVSNILITQGYLVGSSRYQNEDVQYINRIILGRGIPRDVIPQ